VRLKRTVKLRGIRPEMLMGNDIVESVYDKAGLECTITSGNDSKHSRGSLHFTGAALDYRTRHVPRGKVGDLVLAVKSALGEEFDVLLEHLDKPQEHLHVEYQPKG